MYRRRSGRNQPNWQVRTLGGEHCWWRDLIWCFVLFLTVFIIEKKQKKRTPLCKLLCSFSSSRIGTNLQINFGDLKEDLVFWDRRPIIGCYLELTFLFLGPKVSKSSKLIFSFDFIDLCAKTYLYFPWQLKISVCFFNLFGNYVFFSMVFVKGRNYILYFILVPAASYT